MDRCQKIFLELTDGYLHKKKSMDDCLSETDMDKLYRLSVQHSLIPVIYEQIHNYKSFLSLENETKLLWKRQAVASVMTQAAHTEQFLKLYKGLCEENIECLVVKGIICRQMYPGPDYRCSKDEDLYVNENDYIKCHRYLVNTGLIPDNSVSENNLKDIHVISYRDEATGLHIELHRTLFEEESDAYGYMNKYFKHSFESKQQMLISGVEVNTLGVTDNLFYLICHAYKHFIMRGFGIRQLCDILLYAEKYGSEADWKYIRKSADEIKAGVFLANLWDIGERWFEFSKEKAGIGSSFDDIKPDSGELLDDLLDAGIFGKTSDGRIHSNSMTLNAVANRESGKSGNRAALGALFPGYRIMKNRYSVLNRFPVMLPVLWMHRIIVYAFRKRDSKSAAALTVGKQRIQLLKKYGIIEQP